MKKIRTKRILSLLLTLCVVLTLVPMSAVAANTPTDKVTINGVELDASSPYLIDGARKTNGDLNGTNCTAYLDVATGTLSLWNYNGNTIIAGSSGGIRDLTVKLKGSNTISELRNGTDGGNLIITAEEDASLSVVNSRATDSALAGIATYMAGTNNGGGSISITGKAKITISVTNTSTGGNAISYGLFAKQGISISDSASLDVTSTCYSPYDYRAYGIYTENQAFTANTSGVIRVDVSNPQNTHPLAIEADSYSLTKVDQLLCKYNSTGHDFFGTFTPPDTLAYNKGVVSGTPTTEIRGGSTPVRTTTIIGGTNNFGNSTGQHFGGDKVGLSARDIGIPFSSWQSTNGTFINAASSNTSFTMPNEDVTITARYNAFNVQPSFTKTEDNEGTVSFTLNAPSTDAPILVTSTGTDVVANKYFNGSELSRSTDIRDGEDVYGVPAGDYRVAVEIGGILHFSDVFTVDYDALVTTYAVAVTDGTGGGDFVEGATVSITAGAPATGKVFDKWTTSDGVTFADANSATTTFVMPAKAVTVTATYKDAPVTTYAVTVNSGTGGGDFAEGATVSITAGAPATGKVFDKWMTADGVTFADANSASTTFVMPAKAVAVTATYKDISSEIPDYKIIAGENGIWSKDNTEGLVITSDGDYDDFTGVSVDDILIDSSNYTSAAGSTVVTLKPAYLETLAVGTHIVALKFGNYSVLTNLTILAADDNKADDNKADDNKADDNKADDNKADDNKAHDNEVDDNKAYDNKADDNKADYNKADESKDDKGIPKTGERNYISLLIGLILLSGSALIGVTQNKKKKKSYNK